MATRRSDSLSRALAPCLWAACMVLCGGLILSPGHAAEPGNNTGDPLVANAVEAYLWGYPLVYNMGTFNHFLAGPPDSAGLLTSPLPNPANRTSCEMPLRKPPAW